MIGRGLPIIHDCSHSSQLFVKIDIGHELHPGAIRTPAMDGARNLAWSANCRLKYIDMCRYCVHRCLVCAWEMST